MAGSTLTYSINDDRPGVEIWWFDDDGTLIDFSSVSYTFAFKIGVLGSTAVLSKSSGITGAVGAGTEPTGTPNLVVTWTAGELAVLTAGTNYTWVATATLSGLSRSERGRFVVLADVA